jgi:glycosyltransferase involved in cell wall biosynthesis
MKIIHLTPGTGNFHCGSCHRDNHLVKALRKMGHDVTMVPLYLPLVTDGPAASGASPLFAGGINMFLQQKLRIFRKTPRWLDKWLDAPRLLLAAVKRAGMTSPQDLGEMTLESLRGTDGNQAKEWNRLLDWIRSEGRPDLVSLSNGLLTGLAKKIHQELGVPVVCSLQGEDSFLDTLPEPYRQQSWDLMRENATWVARYIATSDWYAARMRQLMQQPLEKIRTVYNGLDYQGYSPAPAPPETPTIGFLARMIHGKGIGQLVDAFLILAKRNSIPRVRLCLGGTKTEADEPFLEELRQRIAQAGLSNRVEWHPNLSFDEKIQFFQKLTIFSVPATYGEAFGLYVLEALACGVPVVEPDHAGLGELVRQTGGGLLCEADSPESLANAMESLLLDPLKAAHLAQPGRDTVLLQFSADAMAKNFLQAVSDLT